MNDDAPDLPTPSPELDAVAAVLDGNATPDDQALVDASPALQALLADLAADKAAIADVSDIEITTEVREWSIAAALGAYDQMLAGATSTVAAAAAPAAPTEATVLRFERRRRTYQTLMGAAAAVAVVFVGVAVVGGLGGSDNESPETPMAVSAKADTTEPTAVRAATSAESGVINEADATAVGDTTMGAESVAPSDTTAAPAYTIGVSGATVGSDLQTPQELVDFALGKPAMALADGVGFPCVTEGAEAIGTVRYQGVDAIVTRDPATGQLTAFDLTTCAALVQAGP
jgi:hypothetical protein